MNGIIKNSYRIDNGTVITMDKNMTVIEDGVVVFDGDKITYVGSKHGAPKSPQAIGRIDV